MVPTTTPDRGATPPVDRHARGGARRRPCCRRATARGAHADHGSERDVDRAAYDARMTPTATATRAPVGPLPTATAGTADADQGADRGSDHRGERCARERHRADRRVAAVPSDGDRQRQSGGDLEGEQHGRRRPQPSARSPAAACTPRRPRCRRPARSPSPPSSVVNGTLTGHGARHHPGSARGHLRPLPRSGDVRPDAAAHRAPGADRHPGVHRRAVRDARVAVAAAQHGAALRRRRRLLRQRVRRPGPAAPAGHLRAQRDHRRGDEQEHQRRRDRAVAAAPEPQRLRQLPHAARRRSPSTRRWASTSTSPTAA